MRPTELSLYLEHMIEANMPVCITGRPGIGKTDIVEAATAKLGYKLQVNHPVVDDPIDYKGLPGIQDGLAEFIPYGNLRSMIEATEPLVVFLDDLGQAAEAVQKALMQLLLSRSINGKPLSPHVRFVAATNRKEDKAGVTGLLEPVKSRFHGIVELEVHLEDWKQWAIHNAINPKVLAFADFKPDMLTTWKPTKDMTNNPCPRTMANLSRKVDMQLPESIRINAYMGAIGNAGHEFADFERMADRLPQAEDILANPEQAYLPKSNEPDICCAVASMLAHHVKPEADSVQALFTYLNRFDDKGLAEYAVVTFKNLMLRDEKLVNFPPAIRWAARHSDLIY